MAWVRTSTDNATAGSVSTKSQRVLVRRYQVRVRKDVIKSINKYVVNSIKPRRPMPVQPQNPNTIADSLKGKQQCFDQETKKGVL